MNVIRAPQAKNFAVFARVSRFPFDFLLSLSDFPTIFANFLFFLLDFLIFWRFAPISYFSLLLADFFYFSCADAQEKKNYTVNTRVF